MDIVKLDNTSVSITTPQPDRIETVKLDYLVEQETILTNEIKILNDRLTEVKNMIYQIKLLGVKTEKDINSEDIKTV